MNVWVTLGISALTTVGIAAIVLLLIWLSVRVLGRKVEWLIPAYEQMRPRLRIFVLTLALLVTTTAIEPLDSLWWSIVTRGISLLLILAGGFLIQSVVNFTVGRFITTFEQGDQNNVEIRRIETQLRIIKRLANAIIGVVTVGFALFTFPQVQAVGAGLLASAGVLGVIGGLAAQSVLGNLFAGVQLAFSNAIRRGDVVVVEGQWGTIGEITLSYVVVYVWDERRLIVPSTYFTSKSFETWTRNSSKMLGTIFLDMNWRVPLAEVRKEFASFLEGNELFDGRTSDVVVTDATGGFVEVRFLVSAADSSKQWDLRCAVREHMVTWLQKNHPDALPVSRVQLVDEVKATKPRTRATKA